MATLNPHSAWRCCRAAFIPDGFASTDRIILVDRQGSVCGSFNGLKPGVAKAGVESTLVVVKGAGHSGPKFTSPENLKQIEEFFGKHLRKPGPGVR